MRFRTRSSLTPNTTFLGTKWTEIGGVKSGITNFYCSESSKEQCYDEVHKRVRTRHGFRWKSGGPFDLKKITITRTNSVAKDYVSGPYRYSGSFCTSYDWLVPNTIPGNYLTDSTDLKAKGATGIARSKPGRPIMGIGQALAEARQLPSIPRILKAVKDIRKFVHSHKDLGSEYLNIEFGWKPLIRDLQSVLNYSLDIHRAFEQLKRDNGKVVRRRAEVDKTESSQLVTQTGTCGTYPILHTYLYANIPLAERFKRVTYTKTGSRYWFEGAFRYWIPNIEDPYRAWVARQHLSGILPTPDLLWQIMPWSWLIDWFSNVGDVISNMSANAAQDLVVLYGFSMGHKWQEESRYAQSVMVDGTTAYTSGHYRNEVKRREKASKFGFGLELPDFDERQLAILAALGLSRL